MLTTRDWLKRAAAAGEDSERVRCLAAAEAGVRHQADWVEIARGHAARLSAAAGAAAEVRRCLARAIAEGREEIWIYRKAAELLLSDLQDPAAARAALDAAAAAFAASPDVRPYLYVLLAGGYQETLQDPAAARRCLEAARARARSADDLCAVAGGYGKLLGEVDTGRALLREAEASAAAVDPATGRADTRALWTIANTYENPFGDDEAVLRVLAEGAARAETLHLCVTMAFAAAGHGARLPAAGPLVRQALARGEALACGAADWLKLAEGFHVHARDPGEVRRCLERALALAPDASLRGKIARSFRHFLGDAEAAERVAPHRGALPEEIAVRRSPLPGWQAAPGALLTWLRARVTDRTLRRIASADYGSSFEQNLAPLRDIYETGALPRPLDWHPLEVLSLTRWSEGERTDHLARAFACAILCIDATSEAPRCGEPETVLPQLLDSCLRLGPEALVHLRGLAVALLESREEDEDAPLLSHGLLLCAAAVDPADPRLPALAARVDALAAQQAARPRHSDSPGGGWLWGSTYFQLCHPLWRALTAEVLGRAVAAVPSAGYLAELAARAAAP